MDAPAARPTRLLESAGSIICITLLASGLFLIGRLDWADRNPSALADVGRDFTNGEPLPEGLVVRRSVGFDGQFYYRLALNPFTTSRSEHGLTFDQPARRQQRILYPLLAWAISGGGQPRAAAWALIGINLASYVAIAWLGIRLARETGRSPPAALLFAAVPGLLIALAFDTSEVFAIALLLGALLLLRSARFGWATVLLTSALFARETTLAIAIGLLVAIAWGWKSGVPYAIRGRKVPLATPLVPIAFYIGWQILLWARWGKPAFTSTDGSDLGLPIVGLTRAIKEWSRRGQLADNTLFLVVTVAVLAVGLVAIRRSSALLHEKAAFAAAVVLVSLFQWTVWIHYAAYLRAASEAYILAFLIYMADEHRSLLPLAPACITMWGYLFVQSRVVG